jgi:MFS family permease
MTYIDSLNLIMIMNGIAIIGRVLPNWYADRVGSLTLYVPAAGSGALIMYTWTAINSPTGLYVWAAIAGITFGAIQALFPTAVTTLTTDLKKQGTRIGMIFTVVSFATLTGPPIAGALISASDGSYFGAQLFSGTSLVFGMLCLAVSRESKRKDLGLDLFAKV